MRIILLILFLLVLWVIWNGTEGFSNINEHVKDRYTVRNQELENINKIFPAGSDRKTPYTLLHLEKEGSFSAHEDQIKLAYNDYGSKRDGQMRPFNDAQTSISEAIVDNPILVADTFDNTYYQLALHYDATNPEFIVTKDRQWKQIESSCISYGDLNECMTHCSNTPNCIGFVKREGKCCMLTGNSKGQFEQPLSSNPTVNQTYFDRVAQAQLTEGNIVFHRKGDNTYQADVSRDACQSICPKCVDGVCPMKCDHCPENCKCRDGRGNCRCAELGCRCDNPANSDYKCLSMVSDPRSNFSCIITNNPPKTDNPNIPFMAQKLGLDEYRGYGKHLFPYTPQPFPSAFSTIPETRVRQRALFDLQQQSNGFESNVQ